MIRLKVFFSPAILGGFLGVCKTMVFGSFEAIVGRYVSFGMWAPFFAGQRRPTFIIRDKGLS